MGFLIRGLMIAAGTVTALFVAQDAPNFGVVQGMVMISLVAFVVLLLALWRK